MLEAGSLRNRKVFSKNNNMIGIVQNVLFKADPVNPLAFILVFLKEKGWFSRYLDENWGRIGIEMLTTLLPDQASNILDDVKAKGEEEAVKVWKAYLKDKTAKEQTTLKCYLFPSSFIDESESNEKEIKLKTEGKDVDDFVSIGIPSLAKNSKNMFAFYDQTLVKEQECIIPVTLNKTSIHQKIISDSNHDEGLISDVQLDIVKGRVANLVVDVMGENSGKRLVSLSDLDFDTQKLKKSKLFGACPLF